MFDCSFTNWVAVGSNPVAVSWSYDFALVLSQEFLDIQTTTDCGFTLKGEERIILQNIFKLIYRDQTTMETSAHPVICSFKILEYAFLFISKLDKKGTKIAYNVLRVMERSKLIFDHLLKLLQFKLPWDVINPKLGQKWLRLVFHVPIVIERSKSIISGNFRWNVCF